jgi:hypothetical protein
MLNKKKIKVMTMMKWILKIQIKKLKMKTLTLRMMISKVGYSGPLHMSDTCIVCLN